MTISQDDSEVIIRNDTFEVVVSFCYLGDSIGQKVAVLKQQQTE